MDRSDGRGNDKLRKVKITPDYIKDAEGSCLIELGNTRVICTASVEESVPPFLKGTGSGWVTAEYGMLPRSCQTRIRRGKDSGRTYEIQRLVGRSLRTVTGMREMGERSIWIDCDVIQGDGGTRTASITGSFISLCFAFNKLKTKEAAARLGVQVPRHVVINPPTDDFPLEKKALHIFRTFPHPVIVKPMIGGSSVGMTLADNYHALEWALARALETSPQALVEEFIKGREATVGVIDNFRNEKTYALMPVEIIPPPERPFFDYEAKYSGKSIERVPGNFTPEEKRTLEEKTKKVHEGLGLRHYSRSDFILSRRGIYFLEVNTLPGLTNESLLPKAVQAVGSKLSDFLHHVIDMANRKNV